MVYYIIKTYHKIDVLINNVGVASARMFNEISDADICNSK